jgi:hypothetical protein
MKIHKREQLPWSAAPTISAGLQGHHYTRMGQIKWGHRGYLRMRRGKFIDKYNHN